jgi:hypothetical protein
LAAFNKAKRLTCCLTSNVHGGFAKHLLPIHSRLFEDEFKALEKNNKVLLLAWDKGGA